MADNRAPAVVAAVGVAVVAVAAAVMGPPTVRTPDWLSGDGEAEPVPNITLPEVSATQQGRPLDSDDTVTNLDITVPWPLLMMVALMILAWIAYRLRHRLRALTRRFGGRRVVGADLEEVVEPDFHEAAHKARGFLLRSGVPGDEAVISAWLALEEAAAQSGVRRHPAETPSEFTAHLLAAQHADPTAVERLLHLYHRARFATDPHITRPDIEAAAVALDTIVDSLESNRAASARPERPQ